MGTSRNGGGENFSLGYFCKKAFGGLLPICRIFISGPCGCGHSSQKDFSSFRKIWCGISKREGRKKGREDSKEHIFHFVEKGQGICPRLPLGDIAGGD